MMRKLVFILLLIGWLKAANAQFGIQMSTGINYFQDSKKEAAVSPSNSLHYSIGPSYWFRLKNLRVEFNPALVFDYNHSEYLKNDFGFNTLDEYNFALNFPILIYPLDFGNDCHCPTFNKSGQFFEKGFYFLLYPSLPYSSKKVTIGDSSFNKSFTGFQLGIGAGIDIGLNKNWTISPGLMVSKFFKDTYALDTGTKTLVEDSDNRYRIDLLIRLIWFEKSKR
jgi:hypothetical protein